MRSVGEIQEREVVRLGMDDAGWLEVLAVVDYFGSLNNVSEGMAIESDIAPYKGY